MSIQKIIILITLIAGAILFMASAYTVEEREQVIVMQFGNPEAVHQEPGLYFKKPFIQDIVRLDRRILSLDINPIEVITKDQDRLLVDSFARYKISDPLKSFQATRSRGLRESRLENILVSSLRLVVAESTFKEVVSGDRQEAMRQITERTNEEAQKLGLAIVDVRLKRVDVPTNNRQKIFDRMETERKREAAEERAKGQAEAQRIRAEANREYAETIAKAERESLTLRGLADAHAVKVYAEAFGQDKEFFEFYRTMQTYKSSLKKEDTKMVLSPDNPFFKLLMSGGKKK